MAEHIIKKGLNLPITGVPAQEIDGETSVSRVAVLGVDYPTMKPRMHVAVGDVVKRGQLLFDDRKSEGVRHTAPAAGEVVAVNRGEKRVFVSIVIALSDGEKAGSPGDDEYQAFEAFTGKDVGALGSDEIRDLLVESGQWVAFRSRPFGRVPSPSSACHSIFVTAMDTEPLAASVETVLADRLDDFRRGLTALTKLTEGPVRLCVATGSSLGADAPEGVSVESFTGPHPAGLAGTHIHMVEGVHRGKTVWEIGYQDVASIGALVATGRLDVDRVVSLAGPLVKEPRLVKTRAGASTMEIAAGQVNDEAEYRVVSGSVLYGRRAQDDAIGYLGRYHRQIACLAEDRERVFLGWLSPGMDKFSTARAFASRILGRKKPFDFTTNKQGSHRAMVPIGMFERVMPLDILPTFLLRALLVGDLEYAEKLGALELTEEDLALCSFVSPGKEDYGVALRKVLNDIWLEGA